MPGLLTDMKVLAELQLCGGSAYRDGAASVGLPVFRGLQNLAESWPGIDEDEQRETDGGDGVLRPGEGVRGDDEQRGDGQLPYLHEGGVRDDGGEGHGREGAESEEGLRGGG